jgi:lysyl-tRNA synthetase class 2
MQNPKRNFEMCAKYTNIEQIRLDKVARLREQDIEPYPHRVERTHNNTQAIEAFESAEAQDVGVPVHATLVGRIRSMRPMGKITFAHIEDGYARIQILLRANEIGAEQVDFFNKEFDLGDFIQVSGEMFRTRTGEATLRVDAFQMIAKSITPLPAAKDELVDGEVVQHATLAEPELRYRQRYADLAVNADVRRIFRVRAAVIRALRDFLDSHDFLEVETPVLQPIYGGAAARPFVTYHNQLKQELYLRISFELYLKRLLVGGYERVYEIGRDFRNEGVDRTHNPEFTQLEFYMAYADYRKVMEFTEQMIAFVTDQVMGKRTVTYQSQQINLEPTWQRMELSEGLLEITGIDINEHTTTESLADVMRHKGMDVNPNETRGKLIDGLLDDYLRPTLIQPTFVYNYPRDISPLAKSLPGNPKITERFEGYLAGIELLNAFTELNDPLDQESRFLEMGRDYDQGDEERHPMDEDYLRAMRYGMPPNGGFGMGVDRLTMLMTDSPNIREVILFPHLRKEEE